MKTIVTSGVALSTEPLVSELCLDEGQACQTGATCMRNGGENVFRCVCGSGMLVFDGICMETSCLGTDGLICGGNKDLCLLDTRKCYVAPVEPDPEEEETPGPQPTPTPDTPGTDTQDDEDDKNNILWIILICCGVAILLIIVLVLLCCAARKRKQKKQGSKGPGDKKAAGQGKREISRLNVVVPN